MKYYFTIGIIIGLILIIYSIIKINKIIKLKQAKATILGNHFNMGRNGERVTRIEYEINNIRRQCDLNYYSIFLKKGKKINIYYNPNNCNEVYYIQEYIFTFLLGIIFLLGSLYFIFFL